MEFNGETAVVPQAAIIVEFAGVTGGGKSTLRRAVSEIFASKGLTVTHPADAILSVSGLGFVRNRSVRLILLDFLTVFPGLVYLLFSDVGRQLLRLASSEIESNADGIFAKANLFRNFFKRVGMLHLLRRRGGKGKHYDYIFWDDGVLHIAHSLFVHVENPPNREAVLGFKNLIPKPDLAIWVSPDELRSIDCTLKRGHSRVEANNQSAAETFVKNAGKVFECIFSPEDPVVGSDRFLRVDIPHGDNKIYGDIALQIAEFLFSKRGHSFGRVENIPDKP